MKPIPHVPEVGWYEQAFGFRRRFIHPSGNYGELATGETSVAFATHVVAEWRI